MNSSEATAYVREMIRKCQVPGEDLLEECLLTKPGRRPPDWGAGIVVSTGQGEQFYRDIFHFWVNAFYFFIEDTRNLVPATIFKDSSADVQVKEISPSEFKDEFLEIFNDREQDPIFLERQSFPETHIDLKNRSFSKSYSFLAGKTVRSAAAQSDGEFVAYFELLDQDRKPV